MSDYKIEPLKGVSFHLMGQVTESIVYSPLPKDHTHYALIGRVAANWTLFEFALDECIWWLSRIDRDVALCITGHLMGATPRFKMIDTLASKIGLPEEHLKPMRKLKAKQYEVGEKRNRIVHDPWFIIRAASDDRRVGEVLQQRATGRDPVTKDYVLSVIAEIRDLTTEARKLTVDICSTASALLEKQA